MERVVHTLVEDVAVAIMIVLEYVVPVVAKHRAIKTGALHSVAIYYLGIVLVDPRVITVVMNRATTNVVVLVPLVVLVNVEIVPERALTVVLVPPIQEIVSSFLFVF